MNRPGASSGPTSSRITASVDDSDDIVQDTYIKASENIDTFRGESSTKTWLFTIASNLAKDNLRARKRWTENVLDIARESALADPTFMQEAMHFRTTSPQGIFEIREHIAFCFTCIAKSLPLEQQICLLLKEIYDFKISEIVKIIGSTKAMVKYYLHSARAKMIHVFEGRCALIKNEGVCHQSSELNGVFNPKQKLQEELMKIEMAKEAEKAGKERLFDLRMQMVQGIEQFACMKTMIHMTGKKLNRVIVCPLHHAGVNTGYPLPGPPADELHFVPGLCGFVSKEYQRRPG